jgi:NAD(P)-dependent dehydrogenase (short-subunit alcohol dehydrogenase family)
VRIRAGREDEIPWSEPEDRSTAEGQLAPSDEDQMHPAEVRLGEGDGPGRAELELPVPGILEAKLAKHGTEQVHVRPFTGGETPDENIETSAHGTVRPTAATPWPDSTREDGRMSQTRTSLVTGGTGGIGYAVALGLARAGDRVLFVGRDAARGMEVLKELQRSSPGKDHAFLRADLSLMREAHRVAGEALRRAPRLDAVVCCAGVLSFVPEWTDEGLERTLALNYLGRFLLARRTLPALQRSPSGRLVLVANAGKYRDTLDLGELEHRPRRQGLQVSGRTQVANDLLALELARRLSGTPVEVTCVFPGVTRTDVFRNARGTPWWGSLLAPLLTRLGQSPERAARTPLHLASSPQAVGKGGRFYGPDLRERPIPRWLRPERAEALWSVTEKLLGPWLDEWTRAVGSG